MEVALEVCHVSIVVNAILQFLQTRVHLVIA